MAESTLLGITAEPDYPPGHDVRALGPSDSSDSGSDVIGSFQVGQQGDSDARGTGEAGSAIPTQEVIDGGDIGIDHIERIPPTD
jgi:hypothetical protein